MRRSPQQRRARAGAALLLGSALLASGARAQVPLDRAEAQIELAEFEDAARILEEVAADGSAGFERQAVARFYELRAIVRSALGRDRDAARDLAALVTVLEGREPRALPPIQRARFERLRRRRRGEGLRVRLRIRPAGEDEVSARLSVDGDPGVVVRRTLLVCRSGGRELAASDSGSVTVRGQRELECDGLAYGPGGWEAGRSSARWRAGPLPAASSPTASGLDDAVIWALVGAGAGVVLAVLVGVIAYAASSTGVGGPLWMMRE